MAEQKKITIFDSTLRDGAQGEGISFSVQDKMHITEALDELGVDFIEAGNPGSNPKDLEFFRQMQHIRLHWAKLTAFGSTRRKDIKACDDINVQSLLTAQTETVVIFGKAWDFQVHEILRASLEENLDMIFDTVSFLKSQGKTVFFDSEHFFSAYEANRDYTFKTLDAAVRGGASLLVLCDTNGGTMPLDIFKATEDAVAHFGSCIGIHTHNDTGLAVANSLMAVEAGANHVQGTLIGIGERTGNANLSTIIADLELKMHGGGVYHCLPEGRIALLTQKSRQIAEIANIALDGGMPYIGQSAFTHKAGMHIDAVTKNPTAYEHIPPEKVGNERIFLMSEVAGRSLILERIRKFDSTLRKESPIAAEIIQKVKEMEKDGYQYEGADGSFELLVRKSLGTYKPFFKLHYYKTIGEKPTSDQTICSYAQLKIEVNNEIEISAGEGDGPVHALDTALRKALSRFYPQVAHIRLTDYKVRVLDSKSATAAKVRVLIESTDGNVQWTTVGVSTDVMAASWYALVDSFEYKLLK